MEEAIAMLFEELKQLEAEVLSQKKKTERRGRPNGLPLLTLAVASGSLSEDLHFTIYSFTIYILQFTIYITTVNIKRPFINRRPFTFSISFSLLIINNTLPYPL
jgi:hypothetical protein